MRGSVYHRIIHDCVISTFAVSNSQVWWLVVLKIARSQHATDFYFIQGSRLWHHSPRVSETKQFFTLKEIVFHIQNCFRHLDNGTKFEDPEFPAENSSLSVVKEHEGIEWIRASEFVDDPKFIVDGTSRFDINQGQEAADCWFLSSLSSVVTRPEFFKNVCPPDQGSGFEAGIFKFRYILHTSKIFWTLYKWTQDKSWDPKTW